MDTGENGGTHTTTGQPFPKSKTYFNGLHLIPITPKNCILLFTEVYIFKYTLIHSKFRCVNTEGFQSRFFRVKSSYIACNLFTQFFFLAKYILIKKTQSLKPVERK